MIPSIIQKLEDWIPPESERVKNLYNKALAPDSDHVTLVGRYLYASCAIICSSVNVIGYGALLVSRVITSVIYLDIIFNPTEVMQQCFEDAKKASNSLYFTAGMATLIFITVFNPSAYFHKTSPVTPSPNPIDTAPILKSEVPAVFKVSNLAEHQAAEWTISADLEDLRLNIEQIKDIKNLRKILKARRDLVLIMAEEDRYYLIRRNLPLLQTQIKEGTITIYHYKKRRKPSSCAIRPHIPSYPPQQQAVSATDPDTGLLRTQDSNIFDSDQGEEEVLLQGHPQQPLFTSINTEEESQERLPNPIDHSTDSTLNTPSSELGPTHEEREAPGRALNLADSILDMEEWSSIEPSQSLPSPQKPTLPIASKAPAATSFFSMDHVQSIFRDHIVGHDHISKEMKYRAVFAHLIKLLQTLEMRELIEEIQRVDASVLKSQCEKLIQIIDQPQDFTDARDQYRTFVEELRKAKDLCKGVEEGHPCFILVHRLAFDRFAGIALYDYCQSLVESVTRNFDQHITLDNFWEELQQRNQKVKEISAEQGVPKAALMMQKVRGHTNILFDPLMDSNVPYIYGEMLIEGRVVRILRHGVAVSQSEPLGIFYRAIWGGAGNIIPDPTSDYVAFIKEAGRQGKNILHLIFENADWKLHGDESARVRMRLNLAKHPNFFPIALRVDGPFFQPKQYTPQTIDKLKEVLTQQLLGDIDETGFCIPKKIKASFGTDNLSDVLKACMDDVQAVYFQDIESLPSLGSHQAFILLTYAKIATVFCKQLDISILEAHCKDDIDRGGAFKAILILDHLYRTGNLNNPQMLKELMVNIIAAPLIVKKQPILPDRAIFIHHVIEVLQQAMQRQPLLTEPYAYQGNFRVVREPGQGIVPTGGACRTYEEYQRFLDTVIRGKLILQAPIHENLVAKCAATYKTTETIDREQVRHQIVRDLKGLNLIFNKVRLNPERLNSHLNREEAHAQHPFIPDRLALEIQKAGISEEESWEILATFQQAFTKDLFELAHSIFANPSLRYNFLQDSSTMNQDSESGITLVVKDKKASIQSSFLFKVIDEDLNVIARVRAAIEMTDHRIGHAFVTMTLV